MTHKFQWLWVQVKLDRKGTWGKVVGFQPFLCHDFVTHCDFCDNFGCQQCQARTLFCILSVPGLWWLLRQGGIPGCPCTPWICPALPGLLGVTCAVTNTGLGVPRDALGFFTKSSAGQDELGWSMMVLSTLVLSQDGVWVLGENSVSTGLHIHGNPCRDVSRAGLRG